MDLRYHVTYRSMLLNVRICGFPIPWLELSALNKVLWALYDILVFIYSLYILICASYAIGVRANFQDLCSLGIVVSQMTNGILITFHYIFLQKTMRNIITKTDAITEKILQSPLGHQEYFIKIFFRDHKILRWFTRISIVANLWASAIYVLPMPVLGFFTGNYRDNLPIPIIHLGLQDKSNSPIIFELIIFQQVLVLVYASIKKIGNDCIFLSFFKIQSAYLKYLSMTMHTLGEELAERGGVDKEGKLSYWIQLHQDVLRSSHDLISLYAPIIVLYYTNLICIIALGLFVQLKSDQVDTIQSVATCLWISTLIFVLYLQSAVADELSAESVKVAVETYCTPWYKMKKEVVDKLRLIILLSNHPIHITAYRAVSFNLNKETFLSFITSVITVYMGFSKIDDIYNGK